MLGTLCRDFQTTVCTIGHLQIARDNETVQYSTLELPWKDNQRNMSCIPAGQYTVKLLFSPKHDRKIWHITGVPGRDDVEIHIGNTTLDTLGCVLVGMDVDGVTLRSSKLAFDSFMSFTDGAGEWSLVVTDPPPHGQG